MESLLLNQPCFSSSSAGIAVEELSFQERMDKINERMDKHSETVERLNKIEAQLGLFQKHNI